MAFCDLHIHSFYSDGTYSPFQIVEKAKEQNLSAISITDHDEIQAIQIAKSFVKDREPIIISGVELSAIYKQTEIHILGYLFDEFDKKITSKLGEMREYRRNRARNILLKLEDFGFHINYENIDRLAGNGAVGRPHIARAMLETGHLSNYKEAFTKYIGNGKPCNSPKYRLSPAEAISLIKESAGVPILAHPGNIGNDEIVNELLNFDFGGIEVWHPDHSSKLTNHYLSITKKKNLVATGGSDNHGSITTKSPIGGIAVDSSVVDALINYKNTYL